MYRETHLYLYIYIWARGQDSHTLDPPPLGYSPPPLWGAGVQGVQILGGGGVQGVQILGKMGKGGGRAFWGDCKIC